MLNPMARRPVVLAIAALALIGAGCGQSAAGGGSATAPATAEGILSGTVTAYTHQHPARGAAPDVSVAVYTQRVRQGGPLSADMPKPVAQARTDDNGRYRITGLAPGRYFVTFGLTGHGWVTLAAGQGAQMNGSVCTDCVIAM
jgi:hypothetical protein